MMECKSRPQVKVGVVYGVNISHNCLNTNASSLQKKNARPNVLPFR